MCSITIMRRSHSKDHCLLNPRTPLAKECTTYVIPEKNNKHNGFVMFCDTWKLRKMMNTDCFWSWRWDRRTSRQRSCKVSCNKGGDTTVYFWNVQLDSVFFTVIDLYKPITRNLQKDAKGTEFKIQSSMTEHHYINFPCPTPPQTMTPHLCFRW